MANKIIAVIYAYMNQNSTAENMKAHMFYLLYLLHDYVHVLDSLRLISTSYMLKERTRIL